MNTVTGFRLFFIVFMTSHFSHAATVKAKIPIGSLAAANTKTKDRSTKKHFGHEEYGNDEDAQSDSSYVNDQMRLLHDILSKYDNRIRPVKRPLQPVNITVRMNLYQIVEVEERTQHVAIYAWMTQMWYDEILAWDPSEYGNVTTLVLPYTQVWIPDTYLYNNLQMEREASERWIHVIAEMGADKEKAHITFRYPAMYKFICTMDLRFFPFDQQRCKMVFGSWMYDAKGVDYYPEKKHVPREDFDPTGHEEWKLLSFTAERRETKYTCCKYPFSFVDFHLVVERRPLHYLVTLLIPTFIVSVVSNIGFFTPTTTGGERIEKVNLGLTTLLAYSVLLMMVSDSMPTTASTVPLIGWFLLGTMVQTSMATIATTIILLLHKKGHEGKRVPRPFRKFFFGCINQYLRVPPPNDVSIEYDEASGCATPVLTRYTERRTSNVYSRIYFGHNGPPMGSRRQSKANCNTLDESTLDKLRLLSHIKLALPESRKQSISSIANGNVPIFTNLLDQEEMDDDTFEIEWEWLASILDRICLITSLLSLCLFLISVIAIGYFMRIYNPK